MCWKLSLCSKSSSQRKSFALYMDGGVLDIIQDGENEREMSFFFFFFFNTKTERTRGSVFVNSYSVHSSSSHALDSKGVWPSSVENTLPSGRYPFCIFPTQCNNLKINCTQLH